MLLLPLGKIGWDAFQDDLGANPIEAVQNRLGFWAITLLALSLVPTPAKDLLGLSWLQRLRRVLGVTAFAYALLHFLFYVGVDKFFDWPTIAAGPDEAPLPHGGLRRAPLPRAARRHLHRRLGAAARIPPMEARCIASPTWPRRSRWSTSPGA